MTLTLRAYSTSQAVQSTRSTAVFLDLGLAISLMAGEVASLLLSRMAVPVLYYMNETKKETPKEVS